MIYSELHDNFFLSLHETFRLCYTFYSDFPHFASFTTGRRVHEHTNPSLGFLFLVHTLVRWPYLSKTHVRVKPSWTSVFPSSTFLLIASSDSSAKLFSVMRLIPHQLAHHLNVAAPNEWLVAAQYGARNIQCVWRFLFQIFLLHYVQVCFNE